MIGFKLFISLKKYDLSVGNIKLYFLEFYLLKIIILCIILNKGKKNYSIKPVNKKKSLICFFFQFIFYFRLTFIDF